MIKGGKDSREVEIKQPTTMVMNVLGALVEVPVGQDQTSTEGGQGGGLTGRLHQSLFDLNI